MARRLRSLGPLALSALSIVLVAILATSGCSHQKKQPRTVSDSASRQAQASAPSDPVEREFEDWTDPELTRPPAREEEAEPAVPPAPEPPVPQDPLPGEPISESPLDELADVQPEPIAEQIIEEVEPEVEEPEFDIPIVVNDQVRFWIDYYTNRYPDRFQAGIERGSAYLPMFRQIFKEAGIPLDLVYMAHVESAFKDNAYSRARALGIWQFIASTARLYNLKIDYWVDERRDPEKAARAAAAYLTKLYGDFGDWHLALAAYNGGEGRIKRALARSGKTDFWGLAETRYLRRETRNYVPAIIAATLIHKNPETYGLAPQPQDELAYDSIPVEGAVDLQVLADCAGVDFDVMTRLNPMLRRNQTPPNATTDVRVPPGLGARTQIALAKVPQSERVLYVRHRVRSGDTLYDLARDYRVSVDAIQQANNMGRRTMIRVGQELTIPTVAAGRFAGNRVAVGDSVVEQPAGRPVTYVVRRGDTLSHVAKRYNTTPNAIAAASGISVHKVLQIGERITVVPGVRSSAMAASAVSEPVHTASNHGGNVQHTVRRGDTLWKIANRYRTTVAMLCRINGISADATLYPGTKLTVAP